MSFLKELAGHPEYVRMIKQADTMRPDIPPWDTDDPLAVEKWKEKSAMQRGFDLAMTVFRPK